MTLSVTFISNPPTFLLTLQLIPFLFSYSLTDCSTPNFLPIISETMFRQLRPAFTASSFASKRMFSQSTFNLGNKVFFDVTADGMHTCIWNLDQALA